MSFVGQARTRNQTVSFWMSVEERREMEARIALVGMPKGQYFIESLLHQKITIAVGKYKSDRLSLEIRKLRECLEAMQVEKDEVLDVLKDCRALMKQIIEVTESNAEQQIVKGDFSIVSEEDEN